jgi:hypothetical protein
MVINHVKKRAAFVNGLLAEAQACGLTKTDIKRKAFSSYATGNRRIEHNTDELTLSDIFNIATLCHIPPEQLIVQAAANMAKTK